MDVRLGSPDGAEEQPLLPRWLRLRKRDASRTPRGDAQARSATGDRTFRVPERE